MEKTREKGAGCACQHGGQAHPAQGHSDRPGNRTLVSLLLGLLFFLAARLLPVGAQVQLLLYGCAYLAAGWEVLLEAIRGAAHGSFFNETVLMVIASLGAFALGDWPEGVAVMLFYGVGELLQGYAVGKSRRSIAQLMDIRPDKANRMTDGAVEEVPAEQIQPSELILVRAGERIPLDGVVVEGVSALDTSALTGEAMPRDIAPGQGAMAGCVNLTGTLTLRVTAPFGASTASKILELVEKSSANKAPSEQFISKFARYYTPAVVGIAALIAVLPPLLLGGSWGDFIHRALVFLVISCPCALIVSVPVGFFAGIGCASKNGILVKGGNYLEALCHAEIVVLDKTGTLTQGQFQVHATQLGTLSREQLLYYAAYGEANSNHPIAQSLRAAYGKPLEPGHVGESTELAGRGIRALVDGREVLVGNRAMLAAAAIQAPEAAAAGTAIYIGIDHCYGGTLYVGDAPKPEAAAALKALKRLGITRTVMLTGDHAAVAEAVGRQVGVDSFCAELLPDGKVAQLEQLLGQKSPRGTLLFVGDGMNDAPVLARADVGIAMGGLGTDAAIAAADIVIMDDCLSRLPLALRIARHTRGIVTQNIVFALSVKLIFLTLGALGYASMWGAVFADVGVSLLAVVNAMRALRTPAGGALRGGAKLRGDT